jgi:protease-4
VLVVTGLLIGALLAPIAVGVTSRTSTDTVAIVPLAGGIDGGSAARVSAQIERARQNPSVEAVVLRVNSPGGGASASESLYLSVKRLAEEKPVVVSVDGIAASGAYYASVPADVIYAKPSSQVGSVGVFAPIPAEVEPNGIVAATGPEKVGVGSERGFKYTVETIKRAFANAVMANRGEELTIPRSTVTEAGVYSGAAATRNGMADEIGGIRTATARAAELAELDQYSVTVYSPNGTTRFVSRAAFVASAADDKEMVSPTYFTGIGGEGSAHATVLMLPPSIAYDSMAEAAFVGAGAYEPRPDNATAAPASEPETGATPAGGAGR